MFVFDKLGVPAAASIITVVVITRSLLTLQQTACSQ